MDDISTIDWNEAWKIIDQKKRTSGEYRSCIDRWSDPDRCRSYNQKVQQDNWKRSWERINAMDIRKSSYVLDIGAGPGTLAIPLSGIARHVTALEPALGMRECLFENMRERGIDNITVLPKRWEDVDPEKDLDGKYDVVIASYSFGFPDLRTALEKMDGVSKRYVYLFWFADMLSPRHRNYLDIWEDLYGASGYPGHMPNIIYNLLGQMGILANVKISRIEHSNWFTSLEEAVADQSSLLNLKEERQVSVLKQFLEKTLEQEEGQYIQRNVSYESLIWWEKEC